MEVNNKDGCALCNATWGEHWEEVEGENRFFCCSICAAAFKNMVKAVKDARNWNSIELLEITGNNNTGRKCSAKSGQDEYRFFVKFYGDGRIMDFHQLSLQD